MGDTFQSTEKKGLTHNTEVGTQRIHQFHAMRRRINFQIGIIRGFGQRVIHNFVEPTTYKLFGYQILKPETVIGRCLIGKIGMYRIGKFDIVITVNTQNIFDDIDVPTHIDPIGRNHQRQYTVFFFHDFHFERCKNTLDRIFGNYFSHQCIDMVITEGYRIIADGLRIDIDNIADNLTAGQFLYQHGGTFENVQRIIGIGSPLETERRVGIQAMTTCRLTHPHRIEIGRFEKNIGRLHRNPRLQTAEYAGNAHTFTFVADHQVFVGKLTFHLVKCRKRRTFGQSLHDDFFAGNLCHIETVHRLPRLMQQIVGYIHNIIDRAQTDCQQMFTQPLGTLGHFHVTYRQTAVPRTRLTILDSYRNGFSRRIVDLKIIDRRTSQSIGITVLFEPCGQIAGYPVMRSRIDAIGGNIDLQYIIAFEVVIFLRRSPGYGTLGQYDDTVV